MLETDGQEVVAVRNASLVVGLSQAESTLPSTTSDPNAQPDGCEEKWRWASNFGQKWLEPNGHRDVWAIFGQCLDTSILIEPRRDDFDTD